MVDFTVFKGTARVCHELTSDGTARACHLLVAVQNNTRPGRSTGGLSRRFFWKSFSFQRASSHIC